MIIVMTFVNFFVSTFQGFYLPLCVVLTSFDIDPPFTWAYKKMEDSVKFWESRGWTTGKTQKKSVKAD